jgi:hypothetical protein
MLALGHAEEVLLLVLPLVALPATAMATGVRRRAVCAAGERR